MHISYLITFNDGNIFTSGDGQSTFGARLKIMPNPVNVPCNADQWTKIASGVTDIMIIKLDDTPDTSFLTYKVADDPEPIDEDLSNALRMGYMNQFAFSEPVDLYAQPVTLPAEFSIWA